MTLFDEMQTKCRIRRNIFQTQCPLDEIGLDEMSWIPSLETCLQMFSRVEVDVYPRVGSFKHIAEAESSNAYVSAHGSLVLQPFMFQWIISYRFLFILFDKIKMELFILYLINMRSQVTSSKF